LFGTGEVTEIPYLSEYHDNEATSALLLWNGYSSQPYSWDLDNDGEFDDASGPAATFQAGSGSSTDIVRMKYVYSDAWTFTGLGVPISIPETYVIFETIINVGNVTLAVDAGPDTTISEGSTFNSSGNFTDSGPGPWEATVDYGNGSGVQPLTLNSDKTFTLNHTYSDNGAYTVTVTVSSSDGNESSDAAVVIVENVEPVVNAGPDISIPLVQALDISAGFSDAGVNDNPWSFMIDWGDGSPINTGSNDIQGADTVKGTHQYFVPGFYTIVVTVVDKDGGIATDTLRVEAVNGKAYGKGKAPGQNKEPGEPANGKAHGKEDAPGQNKEPGEPADGKGKAPGKNKEPGEPANGKARGKEDAPGQNK
jgi:hypothetical protein